ncbi:hypothetical protein [uncultured Kordia sp.]|uniref:hypothetical protein n=1 Tax=uncultured Kordia sp. TaxID=507699 RepID=UPI0026269343|nr:hypothetical protein [uncultured Kordia sp.]
MKFRFLLCLLSTFLISCTEIVTETVIEKEIVYLQKVNDTLLEVTTPKENNRFHRFKIIRKDSTYSSEERYSQKPSFDRFDSIYNIQATFEDKHIKVGAHDEYIQETKVINIIHSLDSKKTEKIYTLKKLTQRYYDFKVSGLSGTKHNLQFINPNYTHTPVYELDFYTDALIVYEDEGYLVAIKHGCCTSSSEYELFNLRGYSLLRSNDNIKSIKTENNHYLISALKNEVYDAPTIVIQNKNKDRQYVNISNIDHNMRYEENFHLKFKNNKKPETETRSKPFKEYTLKNLDNLEIWIPFGEIDTLKIPFKNQKAFGIDYPQIEIRLSETK